jgi:hypothetical protein
LQEKLKGEKKNEIWEETGLKNGFLPYSIGLKQMPGDRRASRVTNGFRLAERLRSWT